MTDWTTIRASCPSCGDVRLPARQFTVRVCAETAECSYTFRCDRCHRCVAKNCSLRIFNLLRSSGVRAVEWRLPAELGEPRPDCGPLNADAILDLVGEIRSADFCAENARY